jgi:hypothetical protein
LSLFERFFNNLLGVTQPIQFADQIAASSESTEEYEFLADGVLEGQLRIRFYKGSELDLWLYPKLVRIDTEEDIIQYRGTKKYVDGEDDILTWHIRKKVKRGDKLTCRAVNNNATFAYDYRLDASVNYEGQG